MFASLSEVPVVFNVRFAGQSNPLACTNSSVTIANVFVPADETHRQQAHASSLSFDSRLHPQRDGGVLASRSTGHHHLRHAGVLDDQLRPRLPSFLVLLAHYLSCGHHVQLVFSSHRVLVTQLGT